MRRTTDDPIAKAFARYGRRDAAAGFRQPEAEARYDQIEAHLVAEVRALHGAYLEAVHLIDDQVLEMDANLSAPAPPSIGAAGARDQADRLRCVKEREALLARRAGAHLRLLDDAHQVQRRAQARATSYWAAHREQRRDGEPALDEPRHLDIDGAHMAPVQPLAH